MPRARRKKRGSPSKPWRTILKKANTGAKARTNVRDRAAARRATLVVRPRTPVRARAGAPRTGASLRQHSSDDLETCSVKVKSLKTLTFTLTDLRQQKHESLYGSAQETEIYVRQGRWPGVTSQSGVLIHTSIAAKVRSYRRHQKYSIPFED
jgi:hypothetical protein